MCNKIAWNIISIFWVIQILAKARVENIYFDANISAIHAHNLLYFILQSFFPPIEYHKALMHVQNV